MLSFVSTAWKTRIPGIPTEAPPNQAGARSTIVWHHVSIRLAYTTEAAEAAHALSQDFCYLPSKRNICVYLHCVPNLVVYGSSGLDFPKKILNSDSGTKSCILAFKAISRYDLRRVGL